MDPFANSLDHLLAELERVHLLITAAVWRARASGAADEEFRGLFISEDEIDGLLSRSVGLPGWAAGGERFAPEELGPALERMRAETAARAAASERFGTRLRLPELARLFDLAPFDVDALLVCLAPEFDLRYQRLYAYLQDDATRRHPSIDLVLNLLCPTYPEKLAARARFAPEAPLLLHSLLRTVDDASQPQPPLLARYLRADERIVEHLLAHDALDPRLAGIADYANVGTTLQDLLLPPADKARLQALVGQDGPRPIFYFQGPRGAGRVTAAAALCGSLSLKEVQTAEAVSVSPRPCATGEDTAGSGACLLVVDLSSLLTLHGASALPYLRLALREALLARGAVYFNGLDALLADEHEALLDALVTEIAPWPGLVFLAGEHAWGPGRALGGRPFVSYAFPALSYQERLRLWETALGPAAAGDVGTALPALAGMYRFSAGQIQDAAAAALDLVRWREPGQDTPAALTLTDLHAACHLQTSRRLEALARRITPHYTWPDIVLPSDRLEQLAEITNYVKYRAVVYGRWGFDRKLSLGKGLNILFAGPSGTGKTMAAEIMAGELGLELYKIDLATVVSKYIGETEKNLSRIFSEAERTDAILFFDEADALFGKRSEVRDAHDRYANIEVGYLLQRMEEYQGIVILATNMRKNMDEAFVRRMHFTVEFPFPGEDDRRRIWQRIWPTETPLAVDLDLGFMARRFEVAGGNIRNIALAAAFLAASEADGTAERAVSMSHLIRATVREYQKMGKVVLEGEFGEYAVYARRKQVG